MDLEDRMHVRPAVVRGRLFAPLDEASRRYGADVVLAGQVLERRVFPDCGTASTPKAAIGPEPAGDGLEIRTRRLSRLSVRTRVSSRND